MLAHQTLSRSPQSPVFPVGYPDPRSCVPFPKIAHKSLTHGHPTGRLPPTRLSPAKKIHLYVPSLGNENSAQSFSDRSFWKPPRVVDVRAFGSWISAPKCLFFQDFECPDRSFEPGYPPRMTPGCPRDIRPQNFLFALIFRS